MLLNKLCKLFLRNVSDGNVNECVILYECDHRNACYLERIGKLALLVNIYLTELDVGVLGFKLVDNGGKHFTRTALIGIKVDDDKAAIFFYFEFEIIFS